MKIILLIPILFLSILFGQAQTLTDSNLPIIIINTDGNVEIPDEYKLGATMKVIYRPDGSRNFMVDQNDTNFLNYNGRIGIELRGSSSQFLDKKPYGLTTFKADKVTTNEVSILGMPKENDWVLNSIAFDKSLIRNYLSYDLSRSIGQYAPRCVFCEVVVNGSYKGLYIFMEKIKISPERVNIVKMTNTDISGSDVTGGYITKADKTTGGDGVAWKMVSYNGYTDFIHESPKPAEITNQQNSYIQYYFNNFQKVMTAQNTSLTNGYPSVIDVPSFIDYMLISEISSNADSYQFSTYFHKDRNGKLRAGPIWDFDLTYGNDLTFWNLDRSHTNVWQFDNGDNTGAKFWKDLYNNSTYKCYFAKRWRELNAANGPLNYAVISAKIDQYVDLISEAKVRENNKWGTIYNHTQEITNLKSWLKTRIDWLNSNMINNQTCANPAVPPLVITKINYNPTASQGLLSNDLEFIEITNNGGQEVNLTGIYFKELGINYQFPSNSTLAAYDRLYLASNASSFEQVYGLKPFGKFTRNLSNNAENLVLSDAYGNIIDKVQYQDTIPWPPEANGKGYYLQLTDLGADNSLASSWIISSYLALDVESNPTERNVRIYPNPTKGKLTIESGKQNIISFEIIDLRGRKLISQTEINSNSLIIDIETFVPDIYILKLNLKNGESIIQKINKLP